MEKRMEPDKKTEKHIRKASGKGRGRRILYAAVRGGLLAVLAAVFFLSLVACGGQTMQHDEASASDDPGSQTIEELKELSLKDSDVRDVTYLAAYTALERLDLTGTNVPLEQIMTLKQALPKCTILFTATVGGVTVDNDTKSLSAVLTAEEAAALPALEKLESADLSGSDCYSEILALREKMPACTFVYTVPLGDTVVRSDADKASVSEAAAADLAEKLPYLPDLTALDVSGCSLTTEEAMDLQASYPQIDMTYAVSVNGQQIPNHTTAIALTGTLTDETVKALAAFNDLKEADLKGCAWDAETLLKLLEAYPETEFAYEVPLGSDSVDKTVRELTVPADAGVSELEEALALLPQMEKVDLHDAGYTEEEAKALIEAYPEIVFACTLTFLDHAWETTGMEELDLSGTQVSDPAQVEEAMHCIYDLGKLVLSDWGLTNEQLDALNREYPETRIVWTVKMGPHKLRTDAETFSTFNRAKHISAVDSPEVAASKRATYRLTTEDIQVLQYCTDLIALDLGHNNIDDISVLENCPHMQYLIIADNFLTDISVVAQLKELIYVEFFMNTITDVSVFAGLENLLDLNLCSNNISDFSPIYGLKNLERLWYWRNDVTAEQEKEIAAALPNCRCEAHSDGDTGSGWREHERYFAMRKLFNSGVSK